VYTGESQKNAFLYIM